MLLFLVIQRSNCNTNWNIPVGSSNNSYFVFILFFFFNLFFWIWEHKTLGTLIDTWFLHMKKESYFFHRYVNSLFPQFSVFFFFFNENATKLIFVFIFYYSVFFFLKFFRHWKQKWDKKNKRSNPQHLIFTINHRW